jgi:hypothetical protein
MTVYVLSEGGRYLSKDDESPCPATTRITARQLQVGDILIFNDYANRSKRSAAVTMIEPGLGIGERQYRITTIDGVGKVETHIGWKGSRMFERQCSQEQVEKEHERSHNIVLRRLLESLRAYVAEMRERVTKRQIGYKDYYGNRSPGVQNPKLPGYLTALATMEVALESMYKEVGDDLGIKPSTKKTKKKTR